MWDGAGCHGAVPPKHPQAPAGHGFDLGEAQVRLLSTGYGQAGRKHLTFCSTAGGVACFVAVAITGLAVVIGVDARRELTRVCLREGSRRGESRAPLPALPSIECAKRPSG